MTQTNGILTVQSFDLTMATDTHAITVKNDVTIASNGSNGSETFTATGGDIVSFTVTLADGCLSATINSPTISNIAVEDGKTTTQTFTDASDSFGSTLADIDFCGLRSYEIQLQSDNSVVTWATVAVDPSNAEQYIISADPESPASEL